MKTIVLMFDSLNRRHLGPYGGEIDSPNFDRLASVTATFDNSYCCSMPCMPSRRDFHTARPGFLHRDWGPLEPFDDSIPEILKNSGVHTHLVSDHYHYWEDGGSNYHTRYSTWESVRGQEGDPWVGLVGSPELPSSAASQNSNLNKGLVVQDWKNRGAMSSESTHCQTRTIDKGIEFIERNHDADNWLLQIECFDPHEPFFVPERFIEDYKDSMEQDLVADWPHVGSDCYDEKTTQHLRACYSALIRMCDESLGRVMDELDRYEMWDDTMFVVWTDHGILLGEHENWLKNVMPVFNEIAHTPLFVWDPRSRIKGERRSSLVQPSIDLGPTILRNHGVDLRPDMLGKDLAQVISSDRPVRESAIFGYYGKHVNVTDGRYVYMRGRDDSVPQIGHYTLMPCHMSHRYSPEEFVGVELVEPFSFSKNCQLLKFKMNKNRGDFSRTLLYDLEKDPQQANPLSSATIEKRMLSLLRENLERCEAPQEQYLSLGLEEPVVVR
ncbi:sulfatase [Pelagicoccus mobilis]|uniref:Sulfatase n=1 Tax=Pelagicoccus mobilis TaxID=415221 RepID=A0A934VR46_9BACT|nr:sulfatase [Pelagicoccus mobilis]MBK1877238.1 sulfatase [Pelagicoccus mobilis]